MNEGKIEYPKCKYHATLEPALVNSAEEEVALGDGWEDTPAAFVGKPKALKRG